MATLISDKHAMLGGDAGFLGNPTQAEADFGTGRRRVYQGGEIRLAKDRVEAFEVHGLILAKLKAFEATNTIHGFPTSDELVTRDGRGRICYFEGGVFEGGVIVWRADLGAHVVQGAIVAKWRQMGGVLSVLGYPTSDETVVGSSRRNTFEHGVIQWPGSGMRAYAVHGAILQKWQTPEGAAIGAPMSDETPTADGTGRFNRFKSGRIVWSPQTGAVIKP